MKALKVLGLLFADYVLCLVFSAAGMFATIAITEHWGAGRTANAMMTMLYLLAAAFLLNAAAVFLVQLWLKVGVWWSLLATGAYGILLVGTLLFLGFMSAIIFNR